MKWTLTKKGYLVMTVRDPVTKKKHTLAQHRIVWESQRGAIPEGYDIHHKNDIRHDNRIENLECLPHAEHRRVHAIKDKGHLALLKYHEEAPLRTITCKHCGGSKETRRTNTDYCSTKCQQAAWYREKIA